MGLVPFVMIGFTGIPYLTLIKMAVLPALLYFFNIGLYVVLEARKRDIAALPEKEPIDFKEMFHALFLFLAPMSIILLLLFQGSSIMMVGFWAIIGAIGASLIRKKTRPSIETIIDGFVKGAKEGAALA
jgi:TRAP-type uncharacterized transport system fused permease subunit